MGAKFNPKVGSRWTTKIKNLVVLVNILVALILKPFYMQFSKLYIYFVHPTGAEGHRIMRPTIYLCAQAYINYNV